MTTPPPDPERRERAEQVVRELFSPQDDLVMGDPGTGVHERDVVDLLLTFADQETQRVTYEYEAWGEQRYREGVEDGQRRATEAERGLREMLARYLWLHCHAQLGAHVEPERGDIRIALAKMIGYSFIRDGE